MKVSDSPILNFFRRMLWFMLTLINWVAYIPTFFVIFVTEIVFMFIVLPIIWVFAGKNVTQKIYDIVFKHSNEKLWFVEPWDRGGCAKFESIIPIHGKYIQEYIDLILPKTDSVY